MEIYVVKSGDTVFGIAENFGVSVNRILSDNGLPNDVLLVPGQALIILMPEITHTVTVGETLQSIALRYRTTPSVLRRNNPWLMPGNYIAPGAEITIKFKETPDRRARINGYAYPFISKSLLERELPFLTTITIFGYGFNEQGELIMPDDDIILPIVKAARVAPILLLSSITEDGNFSSERASLLFNTPSLQEKVFTAILEVMKNKGYTGIDIDFEYVLPEDAAAFISFVQRVSEIMKPNGYTVNVDLAPKASGNQRGLLYEAHDYEALGAAADTVLLMTYEWGYTYGPPLAIAPMNQVTDVVDFALTQIPADKIMLGIPNYGYDWTLPFEKGISKAETVGNDYAVSIAERFRSEIQYDTVSQAPWFNYNNRFGKHVVWFEDVRSIDAKFTLIKEKNLLGAGYWNLMRPFAQNWALLGATFTPK